MRDSKTTLEGGEKTYDPSENVKALDQQGNRRQDDLREASEKFLNMRLDYIEKIANLRAYYQEKIEAGIEKLGVAESKRIDSVRVVDVAAVAIANEKNAQAALVLANEVTKSAETLRALVATTAQAAEARQQQYQENFNKRLTDLEKVGSEIRGKGSVTDPQFEQLLRKMDEQRGTKSDGLSLAGQIGLAILTAGGIVFGIMMYFK